MTSANRAIFISLFLYSCSSQIDEQNLIGYWEATIQLAKEDSLSQSTTYFIDFRNDGLLKWNLKVHQAVFGRWQLANNQLYIEYGVHEFKGNITKQSTNHLILQLKQVKETIQPFRIDLKRVIEE